MQFVPLIVLPTAWTSVFMRFGVHLFQGRVSLAEMDRLQAAGERWQREHAGKRVELVVIFPSEARMSLEERTRMAQVIKMGEAHRAASATVILAQGLLASVQRSMLTGMMMLAPAPHPVKVFATLADAARWLHPHVRDVCGLPVRLEEMQSALQDHALAFQAVAARSRVP